METISAISTPIGVGGIGIVRLSGDTAVDIVDKIFVGRKRVKEMKGYTAAYGRIVDPESGEEISEVVVLVMRSPHSYTCEDVVEIDAMGGYFVLKRVLDLTLREGARLAEPGEFTKRAFLNGRIDLSQAEGVMNVISARSKAALRASNRQVSGYMGRKVKLLKDKLLNTVALIEVGNDYPEEDIPLVEVEEVRGVVEGAISEITRWIEDYREAKPLRDGVNMVIVGKPNVGKSSILNALLRKDRSIVTSVPGTTRDIVDDLLEMGGVVFRSVDTAGIRKTEDEVELLGVERSKLALRSADLVLFVVDASGGLDDDDRLVVEEIGSVFSGKVIGVYNKIDLGVRVDERELTALLDTRWVGISALTERGLDHLREVILQEILSSDFSYESEFAFATPRIVTLLNKSLESLYSAKASIDKNMPVDIVSIDLKEAASSLSEVVGDGEVGEDIIEAVFSSFCVGK